MIEIQNCNTKVQIIFKCKEKTFFLENKNEKNKRPKNRQPQKCQQQQQQQKEHYKKINARSLTLTTEIVGDDTQRQTHS